MDTKIASRIWWAIALSGALAVVFGVVSLFYTNQTLLALVYVYGAFALVSGIALLVAAVRAGEAHYRWGWLAVAGLAGVAAGIVSFVWPHITALAFLYLIATWAIITGVAQIAFALQWPDTLAHPALAALGGVLSVAFGILLAVWPQAGQTALVWLLGIYAIAYGATVLYYAYRLRALRGEVRTVREATHRFASGQ